MGMYDEYCLWVQVAVLLLFGLYYTIWDMYMQVLYLGRAPRTKETLLDFREKCRVARHSRVFRWLTGSQRTPGIEVSQNYLQSKLVLITCCEIIIKCKAKEKYIIPFLYITRKIEEKIGNLEMSKKKKINERR